MRISKPIKGSGFFFFQEDPSLKIFGKLKISKSGEILLRLRGNEVVSESHPLFNFMEFLSDPNNLPFKSPPIRSEAIIGEIKSRRGHKTGIRLESDKFFDPQSFQFPLWFIDESKEWSITLKAETVFLSEYSRERLAESPSFTTIRLGFNNLDEWSTIKGLSLGDRNSDQEGKNVFKKNASINADLPEDLSFSITEGLDFKMEFSSHWELYDNRYGNIKQQIYIILASESPEPIKAFQRIIDPINKFFCFATNGSTQLDLVEGFHQESKSHEGIRIFYQSFPPAGKKRTVTHVQEMLFLYKDWGNKKGISDEFEEAIVRWIGCSFAYKQVFDLYFDSELSFGQNLSERFLKLYRGLEHLHRISTENDETRCPNPFLNKRLREVMLSAPHCGGLLGEIKDFSDICTHVRNYYTHLDRKRIDNKLKECNEIVNNCVVDCIENEIDLEILYLKLKFLFQVQFLAMIDLEKKIEEIMNLNPLLFKLEQLDHRKQLYGDDPSRT